MAVFSAGLQGEFRACNAAFTRLIGYSAHELLGRDFSSLFAATEKINGGDPSLLRQSNSHEVASVPRGLSLPLICSTQVRREFSRAVFRHASSRFRFNADGCDRCRRALDENRRQLRLFPQLPSLPRVISRKVG